MAREGDPGEDVLSVLRRDCPHFRNFHFRAIVAKDLINSGTMEAIASRCYVRPDGLLVEFGGRGGTLETVPHIVRRPGGVACSGRLMPSLEILTQGPLDAAVALQAGCPGLPACNKVGIVFAAHPPQLPPDHRGIGISFEESELLGRSTWSEVYFRAALTPERRSSIEVLEGCRRYIDAGAPHCLAAEHLWLLRDSDGDSGPGGWRSEPVELGTAVCFLPQSGPVVERLSNGAHVYADRADRAAYHKQVEAALSVCCLTDCDALVVGCAEGVCGSELFGHPLHEAIEVWREVLEIRSLQFKRFAFALGKTKPSDTSRLLVDIVGARRAEH